MSANSNQLENRLWDAADELRANSKLKASEYSIPVLGIIFLRYADVKFSEAEKQIGEQGGGRRRSTGDKERYQAMGVLYLPEAARFGNLQRIKILEEMAQNLYREWFVKFRFPGHEQVHMVNSALGKIPNNWRVTSLGHLSVLRKDKYQEAMHAGMPLLDIAKMLQRSLLVGAMGSSNELSTSRILFEEDDVLFGSNRPYLHKVALAPCNGVTNVSVLVIRPIEARFRALLAVLLSSIDAVCWADQHSTGTKMPVIKWENFSEMPVILPDGNTLTRFHEIVWPMLQSIKTASRRIKNLRETRDLLLPKLISGHLDVSELDIVIGEAF